jgi:hypothetical protein
VVGFTIWPLYPRGRSPRYSLDRRLILKRWRREVIPFPAGKQTPVIQSVYHHYTDWATHTPFKDVKCCFVLIQTDTLFRFRYDPCVSEWHISVLLWVIFSKTARFIVHVSSVSPGTNLYTRNYIKCVDIVLICGAVNLWLTDASGPALRPFSKRSSLGCVNRFVMPKQIRQPIYWWIDSSYLLAGVLCSSWEWRKSVGEMRVWSCR